MKKWKFWNVIAAITAVFVLCLTAQAASLRPLGVEESVLRAGATHEARVTYEDFDTSTTNTAEAITFGVVSNTGVQVMYAKVHTPFDTGNTNYLGSLALTVGDGGDADRYLASMQLASNSTNDWVKYGNTAWNSGTASNMTFAYGYTTYSINTNITFTFTPNANEATDDNTQGDVSVFLRLIH